MSYELPKLNYAYDALEPYIDAQTMEIHHTKHHQAYIDKANAALKGSALEEMAVEDVLARLNELPTPSRTIVQNNGGGHANHSLFWQILSAGSCGKPSGKLAAAIEQDLGGFESFKESFTQSALNRFGSGWAWLVIDGGKLAVESTANQDSPIISCKVPVLGIDVWEHAYYLKYQNRRPEYVQAFFQVINWKEVERRFEGAIASCSEGSPRKDKKSCCCC